MAFMNVTNATNVDYTIPEYWSPKLMVDADRESFWSRWHGEQASNSAIIVKNELRKNKNGDIVRIQLTDNPKGAGVSGNATLENNEEKMSFGQFTVTPTLRRHAIAFDDQANALSNVDLAELARKKMASWTALKLDDLIFSAVMPVGAAFPNGTTPSTEIYANGRTSMATLARTDYFGIDEISRIKYYLEHQGAKPLMLSTDGKTGQKVPFYACIISEADAFRLQADADWRSAQATALPKGYTNPLFTGALGAWNGVLVYKYGSNGSGIGSPIRFEAKLFQAATAADVTIYIGALVDAGNDYTKFLPTAGFIHITAVAAGTVETDTYTAKTRNTITCSLAQNHGADAVVTYSSTANIATAARGVSRVLGFGREMAARAWTMKPKPIVNEKDYNFEHGIGTAFYVGESIVENTAGINPNSVVMYCSAPSPN